MENNKKKIKPVQMPNDYDTGLINNFGGGNVEWWQNYIKTEINKTNDHWRETCQKFADVLNDHYAFLEEENLNIKFINWKLEHKFKKETAVSAEFLIGETLFRNKLAGEPLKVTEENGFIKWKKKEN